MDISVDGRKGRFSRPRMTKVEQNERTRLRMLWKRHNDEEYRKKCTDQARINGPRLTEFYKEAVMNVYTDGEQTCRHCGQGDIDVLCLDHINDNGNEHRRSLKDKFVAGLAMYRWIVNNDYPPIFQVLCASCNLKKEVLRRRANRKGTPTTNLPYVMCGKKSFELVEPITIGSGRSNGY